MPVALQRGLELALGLVAAPETVERPRALRDERRNGAQLARQRAPNLGEPLARQLRPRKLALQRPVFASASRSAAGNGARASRGSSASSCARSSSARYARASNAIAAGWSPFCCSSVVERRDGGRRLAGGELQLRARQQRARRAVGGNSLRELEPLVAPIRRALQLRRVGGEQVVRERRVRVLEPLRQQLARCAPNCLRSVA